MPEGICPVSLEVPSGIHDIFAGVRGLLPRAKEMKWLNGMTRAALRVRMAA